MTAGLASERGSLTRACIAGAALLVVVCAGPARGQTPPCPPEKGVTLPPTPELPPRPREGPGSVPSFLEGLSSNDAAFEVIVGQGRVLNLKTGLMEGQAAPVIATGDPTVIDFIVLSPR